MKQKYRWLYNRVKNINLYPEAEWEQINAEPSHAGWHFHHTVVPFLIAIFVSTFIGTFFSIWHNFSLLYVLVKSISIAANCFFTLYVSTKLIDAIALKLKITVKLEQLYIALLYSMTAWWAFYLISGILENYATLSAFLLFMGIYGLYPFWVSCSKILNIDEKDKAKFVAVSFFVVLVVSKLITWSFGFLLQSLKIFAATTVINN